MPENIYPEKARQSNNILQLYEKFGDIEKVVNIDKVMNNVVPLLSKGESAINALLADLATIDPGQLDQSRLMSAQMNMSRWQLAAQLLSNLGSSVANALKNTVQNLGR